MKTKKIAFWGLFGQHNLGNEATLQTVLYYARKYAPDAKLYCICTAPADTSARHGITAYPISERSMQWFSRQMWPFLCNSFVRIMLKVIVRIPRELIHWVKIFMRLKGTDLFIITGTGFLTDIYSASFGWPYDVFKWTVIARLSRSKVLFLNVGIGPILRPISRMFIKLALSLATYRSYRDEFSRNYVESLGLKTSEDTVLPDSVFGLPISPIPACDNTTKSRTVVGVGVMNWASQVNLSHRGSVTYDNYINKIATFVTWLLEHDYSVRVIIGDVLYDGNVRQDLMTVLNNRGIKNDGDKIIDEPVDSVDQLLSQLAETDIVVATRFHNLLLSIMLLKPVLSISYHQKDDSLMEEMGLNRYCQKIDQLDVDKLIDQFIELEKNVEEIKRNIKVKAEINRKALDDQFRIIFSNV